MMPLVVIEADVAATDMNVLGLFPSILPATAFMPIWEPILGLDATLGIMVMPDFFLSKSAFLFG
jgi:hypothetical protein